MGGDTKRGTRKTVKGEKILGGRERERGSKELRGQESMTEREGTRELRHTHCKSFLHSGDPAKTERAQ